MNNYLRKFISVCGMFAAATVFAGSNNNQDSDSNNTDQRAGVPPGACQMGEDAMSVSIMAAYTLWTAREGGLCVASTNVWSGNTANPVQGSKIYPATRLNSGFEVGLGANLYHDCWDIQARYEWFRNNNSTQSSATVASGQAIATWPFYNATSVTPVYAQLNAVSSAWRLQFNRVDANMGRSFYAGHYLMLRPFIGLVGMWDTQHFDFTYQPGGTYNRVDYFYNKQTSWGVGPYAGTNTSYFITNDWSVFLNMGAALPWSQFQPTSQEHTVRTYTNATTYQTVTEYWTSDSQYYVEPMIEMMLGLAWDSMWSDNTWGLRIAAAWEEQIWFSHNHMQPPTMGSAGYGDLSLQGFTLTVTVSF